MQVNIFSYKKNFDKLNVNQYINNCNIAYRHWGDINEFNWAFRRSVANMYPDIITLTNEDNKMIAGSGITYRLISDEEKIKSIGILTGSWTLPEYRGRGCFTKIINESIKILQNKNIDFLSAFVTSTNSSYRQLQKNGSILIPSYYIFCDYDKYNMNTNYIEINNIDINVVKNIKTSFIYTKDELLEQYILSPTIKKHIKINKYYICYTETYNAIKILFTTCDSFDSFIYCINELKKISGHLYKKQLFFYTTNINIAQDICINNKNIKIIDGFFTYIPTSNSKNIISNNLVINMCDKM